MTLQNDRFIRALMREPVDRTPVWMMRQAGRYLPEYRATRAKAGDFLSLCKNTDLATEVTLQPLRRYDFDAAILFSDILTIPDAMGLGLYFETGEGPKFKKKITTEKDIEALANINVETDLDYVINAVSSISSALAGSVPLIGFTGSPWTLATYMVEGQSTREFKLIKSMLYSKPEILHQLLDLLATVVTAYLNAQIKAGAQVVQIFDTWGGILSHSAYKTFSLDYMKKIIKGLIKVNDGRKVPCIVFTKNGGIWLDDIVQSECDAIGLDWTMSLAKARQQVGTKVALQGNMDPSVLLSTPERIKQEVSQVLADFGEGSGHIFNLGHGITPDVPPDHVKVFIDAVNTISPKYHPGS